MPLKWHIIATFKGLLTDCSESGVFPGFQKAAYLLDYFSISIFHQFGMIFFSPKWQPPGEPKF
jgi:hypothetical protein